MSFKRSFQSGSSLSTPVKSVQYRQTRLTIDDNRYNNCIATHTNSQATFSQKLAMHKGLDFDNAHSFQPSTSPNLASLNNGNQPLTALAQDNQSNLYRSKMIIASQTNVTVKATTTKKNVASPTKCIMAITESRGVAIEIGFCVFNMNSCEAFISQLADSPTFTRILQKVNLHDPQQILMPVYSTDNYEYSQRQANEKNKSQDAPFSHSTATITNASSESGKLKELLRLQFPHVPIISISRKHFNDELGKQCIQKFCLQDDIAGLIVGVSNRYYCLAAIAGLFHHIIHTEGHTFAQHTIKFTYQGAEGSMLIDPITAKNLELVTNIANSSGSGQGNSSASASSSFKKDSLLGILDHTSTSMGKRLLRMNILQPPCAANIIRDRLDAVEGLCQSEESIFTIQSHLKQLNDLDHSIWYLAKMPYASNNTATTATLAVQHAEMKVNQIIALKQTIKTIQALAAHLRQQKEGKEIDSCMPDNEEINGSILLYTICKILSNSAFIFLEGEVRTMINEEVCIQKTSLGIRNQKCYAAGVNGLLDVARQTYKETTEDIYELASQYSEEHKMQMKLQFNASNYFHITMSTNQLTEGRRLPSEFINVVKKKKTLQFTSLELLQKNERLNESLTGVYLMSDKIVTELLNIFRNNINILYQASEAIALLDMLTSHAIHIMKSENYVRPEFSSTLAIKAGRHPILDHILSFPVVANDTFASLSSSFQFMTGPNMSGKSTYLRQIALLTIMAQIGCFVPAEYACFRLSDQLLSRLANDNTFSDIGTSSFMSEMRETAYLLKHVTNTSIILIDELGRGTSPNDALGITAAVCEDLICTRAYCFFATHLHELTSTLNIYPNVVNLHFKVTIARNTDNDCIIEYQYKVEDGNLKMDTHYGLQTAQILGFPKEVLTCAHRIVTKLKEQRSGLNRQAEENVRRDLTRDRKLLWFADKLLQLGQTEMSHDQLYEYVLKLQSDIIEANNNRNFD
ncbi:muts domain V-domain-containing protein [Mycotypha africana]|uniref:muts domain V-domain-containing protein n=1 Tax=Mycotypha africana TaxID=64632 RepID=UPI0022FFE3F3|nr:muts domain V-domain-containing protein [Mycotypha africana]KAI8972009.1 muts domain V-domain-containing protein [Mycotypha africana]